MENECFMITLRVEINSKDRSNLLNSLDAWLSSILIGVINVFIANDSPLIGNDGAKSPFCFNVRLIEDWDHPMAVVSLKLSV